MNARNPELQPISPSEAKEMYLDARRNEVSDSTLSGYHYRLKHFIRWCDDVADVENMNDLSGRDLQRFRTWRRDDGDLKPITLEGNLDALRVFLRWCESIDAVRDGLHEKIIMPILSKEEERSRAILRAERAEEILKYLRQFEYASRGHVVMEILWETGMRLGALHSLDVGDFYPGDQYLGVAHRPQTHTPLKNGNEGERLVALSPRLCEVLNGWIQRRRPDVKDKFGRDPLIASSQGRAAKSCIRDTVYKVTRPCYYGDECPDDHEICPTGYGSYSKCPLSVSPHAIRRGSITHHLSKDVPEKVVSDRMNVSSDVLDKHYDSRSERQKVEQRRGFLDNI
ncbi:tyrosine-type recombinase/integrase [Haloarchaeobius sp. TZWWS8]|uniref:tyrosine-type recombinase/integrase n=1 Tax=Haloarchaeobius sp. TZWWS8 TaxID=3446121 RepID=UPI003EBFB750